MEVGWKGSRVVERDRGGKIRRSLVWDTWQVWMGAVGEGT